MMRPHHGREVVVNVPVHWGCRHVTIHLFHAGLHCLHELSSVLHHLGGGHCCDQQTQDPCGAFHRAIPFHPASPFCLPIVIRGYTRPTPVEHVFLPTPPPTSPLSPTYPS